MCSGKEQVNGTWKDRGACDKRERQFEGLFLRRSDKEGGRDTGGFEKTAFVWLEFYGL